MAGPGSAPSARAAALGPSRRYRTVHGSLSQAQQGRSPGIDPWPGEPRSYMAGGPTAVLQRRLFLVAALVVCSSCFANPSAAGSSPAAGWHSGTLGPLRWTFRESRRLPFGPFGLGEGQHRRTFVWLGAAAAAPDVAMEGLNGGKLRQPLPMPTAWATVTNVLFIGCQHTEGCQAWCCGPDAEAPPEDMGRAVVAVLRQWQRRFPEFAAQPLHLAAAWQHGGRQLIPATLQHIQQLAEGDELPALDIAGVMIGGGTTPVHHFFSHSLLETGNGETHRSLQMARRTVSCSEEMGSVRLMMNDAQFLYKPAPGARASAGQVSGSQPSSFEYELTSVSTFDRCFTAADGGLDELEREVEGWKATEMLKLTAGMSKASAYKASLARDPADGVFPRCGEGGDEQELRTLWEAASQQGVRLMFYSQAADAAPHCSFYIGIFDADGLAWSKSASGVASTNRSVESMVDIDEDLKRSTESSLWVIGEGPIGTVFSTEEAGGDGRVSWVRLAPQQAGKQRVLSRAGALTLMSTLVGPEVRRRSKLGKTDDEVVIDRCSERKNASQGWFNDTKSTDSGECKAYMRRGLVIGLVAGSGLLVHWCWQSSELWRCGGCASRKNTTAMTAHRGQDRLRNTLLLVRCMSGTRGTCWQPRPTATGSSFCSN